MRSASASNKSRSIGVRCALRTSRREGVTVTRALPRASWSRPPGSRTCRWFLPANPPPATGGPGWPRRSGHRRPWRGTSPNSLRRPRWSPQTRDRAGASATGLLANAASGKVNEIQARDGTVMTNPFSFETLYGRYADSWRVSAKESMLSACGKELQRGIPKKRFYANDLDPSIYNRTRAVCSAAGVRVESLLDACALDVAVIGRATAARVFVSAPTPIAVGRLARR